jgi:hypothetical protein
MLFPNLDAPSHTELAVRRLFLYFPMNQLYSKNDNVEGYSKITINSKKNINHMVVNLVDHPFISRFKKIHILYFNISHPLEHVH